MKLRIFRCVALLRTFLFLGDFMQKEINKRIIYYRKKRGLTQIEVAQKLGMKITTYSQAERENNITCEMAIKLAEIFNIDVKYLLYEDPSLEENRLLEKIDIDKELEKLCLPIKPMLAKGGNETHLLNMFKNCRAEKQQIIMECVYSIYKSEL